MKKAAVKSGDTGSLDVSFGWIGMMSVNSAVTGQNFRVLSTTREEHGRHCKSATAIASRNMSMKSGQRIVIGS